MKKYRIKYYGGKYKIEKRNSWLNIWWQVGYHFDEDSARRDYERLVKNNGVIVESNWIQPFTIAYSFWVFKVGWIRTRAFLGLVAEMV